MDKYNIAAEMNREMIEYGTTEGYFTFPEDLIGEETKYRVDSFKEGRHTKEVFWNPVVARWTAEDRKKEGKNVYLLKEVKDDLYEVLEQI